MKQFTYVHQLDHWLVKLYAILFAAFILGATATVIASL
jgi:hypothetical protein